MTVEQSSEALLEDGMIPAGVAAHASVLRNVCATQTCSKSSDHNFSPAPPIHPHAMQVTQNIKPPSIIPPARPPKTGRPMPPPKP